MRDNVGVEEALLSDGSAFMPSTIEGESLFGRTLGGNAQGVGDEGQRRVEESYASLERAVGGWMLRVVCRLCLAGVGAGLRRVALALAESEELIT